MSTTTLRFTSILVAILAASIQVRAQSSATKSASPEQDVVTLDPFQINESQTDGYRAVSSISGTNLNTAISDLPMGISVTTRGFLDDLSPGRFSDALTYSSSVKSHQRPLDPRGNNMLVRGFITFNVLTDGVKGAGVHISDYMIERIEVVKGPNTLYGEADPGGLINVVTKRPLSYNQVKTGVKVGSWDLREATLDANVVGGDDNELQVRLIGAYKYQENWRPLLHEEKNFHGIAANYIVNDQTTLQLTYGDQNARGQPLTRNSFPPRRGFVGSVEGQGAFTGYIDAPRDYTPASPDDFQTSRNRTLEMAVKHEFDSSKSLRYSFTDTRDTLDYYGIASNAVERGRTSDSSPYVLVRNPTSVSSKYANKVHSLNYNWRIEGNDMEHNLLFGVRREDQNLSGETWSLNGKNTPTVGGFNPYITNETIRDFDRTLNYAEELVRTNPKTNYFPGLSTKEAVSYSLTDHAYFVDSRLIVLGGIRITNTDFVDVDAGNKGFSGSNTDYQAGVMYKLGSGASVYANSATSFNVNQYDTSNNRFFEPLTSDAFEVGLKGNFLSEKLVGTLAYFDITKKNIVNRLFDVTAGTNTLHSVGQNTSKGWEAELFYRPNEQLQLMLGYTYLDTEIINLSTPIRMQLPSAPPETFTSWLTYGFTKGALEGLRMGGGIIYVTGPIQHEPFVARIGQKGGGYTRADAFIRYETMIGEREVTWGLNVSNLTDATYFQFRAQLNEARQFIGSVSVKF